MGDLLSSASLLLAIITVLYGVLNPDIRKTLESPVPDYKAQCATPIKNIKVVIWRRAFPLTFVAYAIVLVFAKNVIDLITNAIKSYTNEGLFSTLSKYSAVSTAFVLIVFLSLLIAIYLSSDIKKLVDKKKNLEAVTR